MVENIKKVSASFPSLAKKATDPYKTDPCKTDKVFAILGRIPIVGAFTGPVRIYVLGVFRFLGLYPKTNFYYSLKIKTSTLPQNQFFKDICIAAMLTGLYSTERGRIKSNASFKSHYTTLDGYLVWVDGFLGCKNYIEGLEDLFGLSGIIWVVKSTYKFFKTYKKLELASPTNTCTPPPPVIPISLPLPLVANCAQGMNPVFAPIPRTFGSTKSNSSQLPDVDDDEDEVSCCSSPLSRLTTIAVV